MRWLVDLIQALLGRRTPEQGAAVVLPSDAAAEPVASTADASASLLAMVIAAGCSIDRAQAVADAFSAAFARFGVTNRPLVQAHILVHGAHESGNFTFVRESTSYSSVQRIRAVFGGNRGIARLSDAEVDELVNNPVVLANIVYDDANRSPGYKLGNVQPGDGWKFRGWGWAQLTGRDVMEAFAKYMGLRLSDVMERTDAEIFALSALWFALVNKPGFLPAAMDDDILKTTVIWNGGTNGLDDRRARLARIKLAMGL